MLEAHELDVDMIIFLEADKALPKEKDELVPRDKKSKKSEEDPAVPGAPQDEGDGEEAPDEEAPGEEAPDEEAPGEEAPDEEAPGGEEEDITGEETPGSDDGAPTVDPAVAHQAAMAAERLFADIEELRNECQVLLTAVETEMSGGTNEKRRDVIAQVHANIVSCKNQALILLTKYSSFAPKVRQSVYAALRKRVSAVAGTIEHVIDGDEK